MTSSTISDTGQVTIPPEVRKHLGLEPFDRIEFVIEADGTVRVERAELALEDVVGIIPALGLSDEEFKRIKNEALAEHYAKKYPPASSSHNSNGIAGIQRLES